MKRKREIFHHKRRHRNDSDKSWRRKKGEKSHLFSSRVGVVTVVGSLGVVDGGDEEVEWRWQVGNSNDSSLVSFSRPKKFSFLLFFLPNFFFSSCTFFWHFSRVARSDPVKEKWNEEKEVEVNSFRKRRSKSSIIRCQETRLTPANGRENLNLQSSFNRALPVSKLNNKLLCIWKITLFSSSIHFTLLILVFASLLSSHCWNVLKILC